MGWAVNAYISSEMLILHENLYFVDNLGCRWLYCLYNLSPFLHTPLCTHLSINVKKNNNNNNNVVPFLFFSSEAGESRSISPSAHPELYARILRGSDARCCEFRDLP